MLEVFIWDYVADMTDKPESQETQLTCGEQGPTEVYRITGKVAEE